MKNLLISIACLGSTISFGQNGPGGVEQLGDSSSLQLWLKADQGVYNSTSDLDIPIDGEKFGLWKDQSGKNNHISQTENNRRPRYFASGLNSAPVIQFNKSEKSYLSNLTLDAFQDQYSMFIVAHANGTNQDILSITFPSTHGILVESRNQNALKYLHRNPVGHSGGNSLQNGTTRSNTTSQILSFNRGIGAIGQQEFWINGSDHQTKYASNYSFSDPGDLVLGRMSKFQNARYLDGEISELIIFSRSTNRTERFIIENHLAAKYGLDLSSHDIYEGDLDINGNHDHDVLGFGKSSTSDNSFTTPGDIVNISSPSNLDNNEYFLYGHNKGSTTEWALDDFPISIQGRLERTWFVSELDSLGNPIDVGQVDIQFNLNHFNTISPDDLRLLIDTDNDGLFADEVPIFGATPIGDNIYEFSSVAIIDDGTRFTLGAVNLYNSPLPIELLNFYAIAKDDLIELNWATGTEVNNAFFTIERSIDMSTWKEIAHVVAAGNTTSENDYKIDDYELFDGIVYYRLKQIDYDGKSEYFNPVSIDRKIESKFSVFPNPTTSIVNVITPNIKIDDIKFTNQLGQEMTVFMTEIDPNHIRMRVNHLPPGVYFIKHQDSSMKLRIK